MNKVQFLGTIMSHRDKLVVFLGSRRDLGGLPQIFPIKFTTCSWSGFYWAVVVHRLPPVLFLALPVCGFAQASLGLGLNSVVLWLCTGFSRSLSCLCWAMIFFSRLPQSCSCLCWAVVFLGLPSVFVLLLQGCGYAQVFLFWVLKNAA